jgi:hypothetical protein
VIQDGLYVVTEHVGDGRPGHAQFFRPPGCRVAPEIAERRLPWRISEELSPDRSTSKLECRQIRTVEQAAQRYVEDFAEPLELHDSDIGALTAFESADDALGDVEPLGQILLMPGLVGAQGSHVRRDRLAQLHNWTVDGKRLRITPPNG